MELHSTGISDGNIHPRFGNKGDQFFKDIMPNRSLPLEWSNLPDNTSTLALTMIDFDAVPPCGFPWIHWTVANIDPKQSGLIENASCELNLLEGANSWSSGLLPDASRLSQLESAAYGGCAPPDKRHQYDITLYALDITLNLDQGFYLNELLSIIEGHVLDHASLRGTYTPAS